MSSIPSALPETIAFIVKNSIDAYQAAGACGPITNINNTINIYSTQTTNVVDTNEVKPPASQPVNGQKKRKPISKPKVTEIPADTLSLRESLKGEILPKKHNFQSDLSEEQETRIRESKNPSEPHV